MYGRGLCPRTEPHFSKHIIIHYSYAKNVLLNDREQIISLIC